MEACILNIRDQLHSTWPENTRQGVGICRSNVEGAGNALCSYNPEDGWPQRITLKPCMAPDSGALHPEPRPLLLSRRNISQTLRSSDDRFWAFRTGKGGSDRSAPAPEEPQKTLGSQKAIILAECGG